MIRLFKKEIEAGLASLIQENNSLAYVVPVSSIATDRYYSSRAADLAPDIFYWTKSILASTSWNKNDDVFGKQQLWAARKTAVDTFTNVNHDHDQLVGHITDTWVMDAAGNVVADDTRPENLPDHFHLCNSAVIYRFPQSRSEAAAERAERLIEEIEGGRKFVSMECVFADFDYAVISPDKKYSVVARNEETAFLTKHLRTYGGTGRYDGHKLGRYLKSMAFSGKGYVDRPANPDSIIFERHACRV